MIVAQLAHQPLLARLYVWATYHGPIPIRQLQTELDLDEMVIHHHVDRLTDLDVIGITNHSHPLTVTGTPIRVRTDTLGLVTPTIIHAIARQECDAAIADCVDTYGVQTLLTAVQQAGQYYADQIPQRTVADPLGMPVTEARHLVDALGHVLAVGQAHDPYFGDLFPDVAADLKACDSGSVPL